MYVPAAIFLLLFQYIYTAVCLQSANVSVKTHKVWYGFTRSI
ncbi:hypothetical protein FLA_3385 [Filimonas lacunae]|nr:hypothetical protein FLA_3385 [Filimonas lacunae]